MVSNMAQWDETVLRAVRTAASRSHSAHRGFVERDDLQQEGYLWCLEHPDKVTAWQSQGRDGANLLHHALYQRMHVYTMKQRYLKDGTKPEDYYWYQLGIIKELLPDALADSEPNYGSSSSDLNAGIGSNKPISEGGDRMAMIADVRSSLGAVTASELAMLRWKYVDEASDEELAELMGVSDATVTRHVNKALRKMARSLGGEPPVMRQAMSNAQSQHITKEQAE